MNTAELEQVVREVLERIGTGGIGGLLADGGPLSTSEAACHEIVSACRVTVAPPPADADLRRDVYPHVSLPGEAWAIDVPIWTKEEGRSELWLHLWVTADGDRVRVTVQSLAN